MSVYRFLALATLLQSIPMAGCAVFKSNNLAPVTPEQLQINAPTKTTVYSRWKLQNGSAQPIEEPATAANYRKAFDQALLASECCTVVETPEQASLIVTGTAHNENNKAAIVPAIITGLSLYTIPSWLTAREHLTIDVQRGELKHSYDLQDSVMLVQWLPMLVVFPFAPFSNVREVTDNMQKTLVVRMKADGLLDTASLTQ